MSFPGKLPFKTFVPGVGKNGCCWGTWMMAILPYVEQDNLAKIYTNFDGLDPLPRYNSGPNAQVTTTRLKTFTCPSDLPQSWGNLTKHNYVLNAGNTTLYQVGLPLGCSPGSPGCTPFLGAPFSWYANSDLVHDSTFPWTVPPSDPTQGKMGRPVKIAEITDGTTNTMMASEAIQGRQNDLRGFTWWGGAAGFTAYISPNSSENDVITGGICVSLQTPLMPCTTTSTNTRARLMGARSLHPNGVNASMCDGSVRFVSDGVDPNAWAAAGSRSGGETNVNLE